MAVINGPGRYLMVDGGIASVADIVDGPGGSYARGHDRHGFYQHWRLDGRLLYVNAESIIGPEITPYIDSHVLVWLDACEQGIPDYLRERLEQILRAGLTSEPGLAELEAERC